ncbi:MAG: hypothetical protein K6G31_04295 [Paludibacteraceae bacterium]|nr:hypothetical protein [Paludibacteraceae bacterium]
MSKLKNIKRIFFLFLVLLTSASALWAISGKTVQTDPMNSGCSGNQHRYDNGFCTKCGDLQEPEKVNGVYQVGNAGQLYWISNTVNLGSGEHLTVSLINDITVNDSVLASDGSVVNVQKRIWTPIGDAKPFKGTFDGQGHTISGLYFNDEYESYIGLFGLVNGSDIMNVHVRDSYFNGKSYIGGICGVIANGETISNITNCSSTAVIVSADSYAGGIAGYASGTISNCYATGNVNGDWNVAGLVGSANNCMVLNSFATGKVFGSTNVDAIGFNESSSTFNNCYCMNGKTQNGFSEDAIAFASGYVCYLLNEQNRGSEKALVWYQNLGKGNADRIPSLNASHNQVYRHTLDSKTTYYSNSVVKEKHPKMVVSVK